MPSGKVYKYGDNVDTDVIIPARYLNAPSPDELAKHCMEDIDATFAQKVQPGDIIVGGANFGCGSSREHAPIAIRACGVSCVIAPSFARIFYRNAINIGFPILECPKAAAEIANGDQVSVDFTTARWASLLFEGTSAEHGGGIKWKSILLCCAATASARKSWTAP